jgi:hypothetical protein
MEQSEEVRSVLSSLIETFGTPRMGPAFTAAVAAEPGVLMVGTDPAEWWDSPDAVLRALQVQSTELQGAATVSHAQGWVQGDIGWGAVKATVVFPDGRPPWPAAPAAGRSCSSTHRSARPTRRSLARNSLSDRG